MGGRYNGEHIPERNAGTDGYLQQRDARIVKPIDLFFQLRRNAGDHNASDGPAGIIPAGQIVPLRRLASRTARRPLAGGTPPASALQALADMKILVPYDGTASGTAFRRTVALACDPAMPAAGTRIDRTRSILGPFTGNDRIHVTYRPGRSDRSPFVEGGTVRGTAQRGEQ